MTWLLLLLILHNPTARADNFPFQLKEVYVDYKHITTVGYDPMLQVLNDSNEQLNNHLDLHINLDILQYFYWDNMVNTTSDQSQFKVIGWEYALGVRLFPFLEGGFYHHSQHWIDESLSQHFPLENAIQFRLIFYRQGEKKALINF